jgi:predicted enzyme related to lactoylglutathione lyase
VEDVEKTYEELKAKGINFVMPPTQREGEGIRLAVALDPDGLPISFAQLLQQ